MLARLVLAYLIALPVFVVTAAKAAEGNLTFTLTIRMTTASPGLLQVFADTGRSLSEAESYVAPLKSDNQPHDYPLKIPAGTYRMFRIDPGTAPGRYTLFRVSITDPHGGTVAAPPLSAIQPLLHLNTIERTGEHLTLETPPAPPIDPQLVWRPQGPLFLAASTRIGWEPGRRLFFAWAIAFGLISFASVLLARLATPIERRIQAMGAAAARRPRLAIVAFALTGFAISAYPVLFMQRSLFSPNNGGQRMLYESMPFVPGSSDVMFEETRKSDVATATWMFTPFLRIQRAALMQGEFPLWNRYNAGGRPLWGQGYGFMLDPLHWLSLAAPELSWGLDLKYLAHRLVFAIGIGLLAFAITGAWLPSALVAASAPFLGLYTFRLNHPQPFVLTYIPWVTLGWLRLAEGEARARRQGALTLALATTLVLYASLPKEAAISLLAAWTAGAGIVLLSPGTWRSRAGAIAAAAVAGLAAILVTAPQWLVFADTLRQSETNYEKPYALFAGLPHAVAFFLGPITPADVLPGVHALALVGLAAALSAPLRLWSRKTVLACALVAAGLVALAFGVIAEPTLIGIPLVGNIGHVHDVSLTAAAPLLLVVCAFGLDLLLDAGGVRAAVVIAVTALAAWAVSTASALLSPPGSFPPFAAMAMLSVAAMLPMVLAGARRGAPAFARIAACTLGLLVLLLPGGLHADTRLSAVNALLFQPRPRVSLEQSAPVVDEIHRAAEPSRTAGIGWVLFPGSQGIWRLEGLSGGGDALQLPQYERLADAAGLWRGWFYFLTVPPDAVARASPFLDMMNVRYVLMPPGTALPGVTGGHVPAGDRLSLGERPSAWPRAFFVDGVMRYADLPWLTAQLKLTGRPMASIENGDLRAAAATRGLPATGATVPATNYVLTTNTTRFHLRAPSAGVAVLTETFLPKDFVVTLNGRPAKYFRVNHAFKGIAIPAAGEWDVSVEYRPEHWRLSWSIAAAGALLVGALAMRAARAAA